MAKKKIIMVKFNKPLKLIEQLFKEGKFYGIYT